jgi:hypothetical protein
MIQLVMFSVKEIGIGIRRTISMSKTRKMTARRKKRRENGIRAEELGSKPHSKGVDFSRFILFFEESRKVQIITIIGKISARIIVSVDVIITLKL